MNHRESCIFCEMYEARRATGFMHETPEFWCTFDIHPCTPGHSLIIPKRHVVLASELTPAEHESVLGVYFQLQHVIRTWHLKEVYERMLRERVTPASAVYAERMLRMLKELGSEPEAFNFDLNDGKAAGQTVPHCHFHCIPRYTGDVPNPAGGCRNMFPGVGDYTRGLN